MAFTLLIITATMVVFSFMEIYPLSLHVQHSCIYPFESLLTVVTHKKVVILLF